jgi:hypothetical protein
VDAATPRWISSSPRKARALSGTSHGNCCLCANMGWEYGVGLYKYILNILLLITFVFWYYKISTLEVIFAIASK